ncbi:MAG: type II toxin-antitoxin system VapC family toxin [Deltaproteobacteria bacterium]|nr:type II toxin-antitoxin system VapC family toxin [Deltaproteobacteria bacterium]
MIVADTHIIIWDALSPEKLSKKAKAAILEANGNDGIIFCDISLWEISMLMNRNRVKVDVSYKEFINLLFNSNNYILQGIDPDIADLSSKIFKNTENDPADKLIAATAVVKKARLVTADRTMRSSSEVTTIW